MPPPFLFMNFLFSNILVLFVKAFKIISSDFTFILGVVGPLIQESHSS